MIELTEISCYEWQEQTKKRKNLGLIRVGRHYSIEEVLSKRNFNRNGHDYVDFDGDMIAMNNLRYHNFAEHGVTCVKCGLVGQYFCKERHPTSDRYHFNLYAVNEDGLEVLMTRDHIIPRSYFRPNSAGDFVDNLQTMCLPCNASKGNELPKKVAFLEKGIIRAGKSYIAPDGTGAVLDRSGLQRLAASLAVLNGT
jgi:hypothetical protein